MKSYQSNGAWRMVPANLYRLMGLAFAAATIVLPGLSFAQNNPSTGTQPGNSQASPTQNPRQRQTETTNPDTGPGTKYDFYESAEIDDSRKNQKQPTDETYSLDQLSKLVGKNIPKPAKPGEFERYIEAVVGRKVPRFGAQLLTEAARDFAVPAQATVPPDYPINVGDIISISLIGSIEGSADFEVDTDGRITIPKIGAVSLVGVRYRDLRNRVAEAVGRQYRGYDVSVNLKTLRGLRVYVTGFANAPGSYSVSSLSTLVNAVLAAGGPNAGGSFRAIKLFRNGRLVSEFDLYDLIRGGDRSRDPLLQNEDVLFIPPVGPQAVVIGSVNEEAIYEVKPSEAIADVLRYAGGANVLGDTSRVILYRFSDKQTLGSRQIEAAQTSAFLLEPGDILQILSQGSLVQPLERQQVIVRIEGEVIRPGNYYVPPNTPLSRVLEMAGGLTPRAYVYGTKLTRSSVASQQRVSFNEAIDQFETALVSAPLNATAISGNTNRDAQLVAARQLLAKLREAEPDGRLVLPLPYGERKLPDDLILENNDRITVPPLVATVGVFGSVYRPASFLLDGQNPPRVREIVEKAGGIQRTGDKGAVFIVRANGEVLTKKRGALSAITQPGDIVFVPPKTQSTSLFDKIIAVSQVVFQLGLSAAVAVAAFR